MVDPHIISGTTDQYGIGTSDAKLYYEWPETPGLIPFETAISIEESEAEIGDTLHWSMGGISGSGEVDRDGCAHVFLAPLFENYHFINFMLHPRGDSAEGANNVMTRKMIVLGSSDNVDVKISDIHSTTTDAVHLIFTGWEYNRGTADNPDWVQLQTVDYTGEEMKDPGRDGVYYTETSLAEKTHIDLYPIFILARWVDFVSGISGGGASFVGSRFLESWGRNGITPEGMTETPDKNVFEQIPVSTRKGYAFDGWYAFAVTDPNTGEITNLKTPADVEVSYIDNNLTEQTATISTKAIRLTDENGAVCIDPESGFSGVFTVENYKLFEIVTDSGTPQLKLFDPLDRLTLYANWVPDASAVTVVYWTENAEDDPETHQPVYTSSTARTITTGELNAQLEGTYTSGSTITLDELQGYMDNSVSILSEYCLDDNGSVPAGEEMFYELNTDRSDASQVIRGDGSTLFNEISRFVKEIPEFLLDADGLFRKPRRDAFSDTFGGYGGSGAHVSLNGSAGMPVKGPNRPEIGVPRPQTRENFGKTFKVEKASNLAYAEGDRVRHVRFGAGTVREITEGARDFEVTVDFDEFGEKRMYAGFAKLERIEG